MENEARRDGSGTVLKPLLKINGKRCKYLLSRSCLYTQLGENRKKIRQEVIL